MSATARHLGVPLSAAQLGVWVAQKINPTRPIFNLGQYVEIHGSVDFEVLERALRQVVNEAETLRVGVFERVNGPRQCVSPSPAWRFRRRMISAVGSRRAGF